MREASYTTNTEIQESNVNEVESKTGRDTENVESEKPQLSQDMPSTHSTENNSQEYPAFKDNIVIETKGRSDEAILAGGEKLIDATTRQDKQAPSTKHEQDRGASDSKENVEEDKKAENNVIGEDEDRDKTNAERETGLPDMVLPLNESASRLETGIAPHDINIQEQKTLRISI